MQMMAYTPSRGSESERKLRDLVAYALRTSRPPALLLGAKRIERSARIRVFVLAAQPYVGGTIQRVVRDESRLLDRERFIALLRVHDEPARPFACTDSLGFADADVVAAIRIRAERVAYGVAQRHAFRQFLQQKDLGDEVAASSGQIDPNGDHIRRELSTEILTPPSHRRRQRGSLRCRACTRACEQRCEGR